MALRTARFLKRHLKCGPLLYHSHSQGQVGAGGYLEDYAWVAKAWISLYQVTFEEHWLREAEELVRYAVEHFYDEEVGLFSFVARGVAPLIASTRAIFDEAIPSANAVMAHNLLDLGVLLDQPADVDRARRMLDKVSPYFPQQGPYMAHWAGLGLRRQQSPVVVALVGPAHRADARRLQQHLLGQAWFVGTATSSSLPWLAGKKVLQEKTTVYVCQQGLCQPPTHSVAAALDQVAGYMKAPL